MYSEAEDPNGVIVKRSDISTFVEKDKNGNLESGVKINADQIKLEGLTTVNNNFIVHTDGSIEAKNGKFTGTVNADSGTIGSFRIEKDKLTTVNNNFKVNTDGSIEAKNGKFTGVVNADSGTIGGFRIKDDGLTNQNSDGTYTNNAYLTFQNDLQGKIAALGGSTFVSSSGGNAVARFENYKQHYAGGTNHAMYISARGANNNVAINMAGGCISGMAVKTGSYSSSGTISKDMVSVITQNESEIVLTLPTMETYDDGHVIKLKRLSSGSVKLKAGYSYHMINDIKSLKNSFIFYDDGAIVGGYDPLTIKSKSDAMELVYHRDVDVIHDGVRYYGCWVQYKHPRSW